MKDTDRARVTTVVAVDPATAFEIFTVQTETWWRGGRRLRGGGSEGTGRLRFVRGAGGRVVELRAEGGTGGHELGEILVWEPGRRLVFQWRDPDFPPGVATEVEVTFEAAGAGTRVTIEHRGWNRLPADFRARHGLEGSAFTDLLGLNWGDQLVAYAARTARAR